MSSFPVLEAEQWREDSCRRQLEDHPVQITDGPRRGRTVEIPIRGADQDSGIRFVRGRRLKLVKRGERTVRSQFENGPMIRGPVKAAEIRAIKRSVGKPDLRKGGELLIQGSHRFKRGAAQTRGKESDSQD